MLSETVWIGKRDKERKLGVNLEKSKVMAMRWEKLAPYAEVEMNDDREQVQVID